jgi:hypothetical protein
VTINAVQNKSIFDLIVPQNKQLSIENEDKEWVKTLVE